MAPTPIDLRSDTVTRPSAGMRAAMAAAEVGDDQFGDDPTVNRLQERIADLLGKEAALWLPTGTMANQVVLRSLTRPGDDVIVSREAHAVWHETGGSGANAGVQLTELGGPGWFTAAEFEAAVKPRGHLIYPPTTLVEVENTHNRAGGVVVPPSIAEAVAEAARRLGIASYLDGARLWNAAVVSGRSVAELAAPFDVAMVSLSKGLGAPGGSVVAARRELLPALVRYRRMSGGAMRQVGIFAAAGLWALDHNLDRLAEDHANARSIAERLAESPAYVIDPASVETNILVWQLVRCGHGRRPGDRRAGPGAWRADLRPRPAHLPGGHPPRRHRGAVRGGGRHPRRRCHSGLRVRLSSPKPPLANARARKRVQLRESTNPRGGRGPGRVLTAPKSWTECGPACIGGHRLARSCAARDPNLAEDATQRALLIRALPPTLKTPTGSRPGNANAHAWVEVYFPGHGWVAFDPTSRILPTILPR